MYHLFLPTEDNCPLLSPSNQLHADMTPAELEIEYILLKERWSLIQASHQRKSIRINSRTKKIYLNNQVYGTIENSKFVHSTQHITSPSSSNNQPHVSQPSDNKEPLITLAFPTPTANDTTHTHTTQQAR